MLTFSIMYASVMLAIYFLTRPPIDAPVHRPRLRFDERASGPWAYFADAIKPPQRKTF
jgi:hypothetical protein